MSRVAIVGVEGSGKTVLMAALGDMFGKPSDGSVYLMPENQSAFSFMTQIPHKMREEHQWPAATAIASMKHLKWTIRIGKNVLMDLEMLDYPGELYRMAFGERKKEEIEPYLEQVHEFLEHLVTADYLVVLLNLKDALNIGGNARNNETVWLTRGIFDYSQKLSNIQKRLLLFTQSDRYPDELSGSGGLMAAKEKYMPMLHVLYPDLECAAVSVATDESDAPARTFSASHGVTGLMRWLALQTEDGTKVQAQLEKFSEWIENASSGHVAPKEIKALLEKLDSINPGLCEILEPNGLERRRNQLRTLYRQSVLAACDACREQAKRAASLDALKQIMGGYRQHLESLSEHICPPVDDKETVAIQAHREDYEHILGLFNLVGKFINTHSSWQLARAQSWLPISDKYTDSTSKNLITRTRSFYAAAKIKHIAIGIVAVIFLTVVAVAVNVSNNAQQERAAAEAKAQQERAAAEAKAQHARAEAEAKARTQYLLEKSILEPKAEQGDLVAQHSLGLLLSQNGQEVQARNWIRKAAENGNIDAQMSMARISTSDEDKKYWLEKAARQGDYTAQKTLASMPGLYSDMVYWIKMAATNGYSHDQYLVGLTYEEWGKTAEYNDRYNTYDPYKFNSSSQKTYAIEWYRKAAAQGHTAAQQALDRLGYSW